MTAFPDPNNGDCDGHYRGLDRVEMGGFPGIFHNILDFRVMSHYYPIMTYKKSPKTANERKADERARKRKAGYVLWQIWVRPEWKQAIKKLIEKLEKGET
jgi:hypothetical protein